jgi:hypothetical protein
MQPWFAAPNNINECSHPPPTFAKKNPVEYATYSLLALSSLAKALRRP